MINNNPAEVLDNRIKEEMEEEIVCKLWTQEPENFDEEVKSLGTAWRPLTFIPTNRQDIIIIKKNYRRDGKTVRRE